MKKQTKKPLPALGRSRAPSTKGVVARAALVFLEHGARAAYQFLGGSLRAEELLPKVFARAKRWERQHRDTPV